MDDGVRAASVVVRVRAIREGGLTCNSKPAEARPSGRQRLQYAKRRRTHRCYCSASNLRFKEKNSVFKGSEIRRRRRNLGTEITPKVGLWKKSRPRFVSRHSNVFRLPTFDCVIRFSINR